MDEMRYSTVMSRIDFIDGMYQSKKKQLKEREVEVSTLECESVILEKTEKILKHLIDSLAKKDLTKMDKLVTYGLNTIFPDKDIRFQSELVERGSKLRINLNTIFKDQEVDSDSQGSITVIESFLLRVLCILKLKKAPFLYMDEPFGAIDSQYAYKVSPLIAEISKKLKLDILLVTHNPTFMEDANIAYKIKSEKDNLTIETLKK
jgi:chromosome segregation ATPase